MLRPVRMGVVGVGSLGRHHARLAQSLPSMDLIGVYDSNQDVARSIAAAHGCKAFASLTELAQNIEAASVVVPTDRHREVAGLLLEHGLHLLVEKPIATTTREAEELVALAQERGAILQVGHVERFNPVLSYLEAQAPYPRFIEAHRLAPYPQVRAGAPPRGTEVSVVLDLMIHDLEILLHLVPSPLREIRAVGVPVLSRSEDIANVRLAFEDGCVANVTASRISPEPMRKIRVFTEEAYLSLDYRNQEGTIHRKTPTGIERNAVPIEKGEPLALELDAFARCVAARADPAVSGAQAAHALRLAVKIMQAIREAAP